MYKDYCDQHTFSNWPTALKGLSLARKIYPKGRIYLTNREATNGLVYLVIENYYGT